MKLRCWSCRTAYRVPEERLGIRFRCRTCRSLIDTLDLDTTRAPVAAGASVASAAGPPPEKSGDAPPAEPVRRQTSVLTRKPDASTPADAAREVPPSQTSEFVDMVDTLRDEIADAVEGWDAAAARRAAEEAEREEVEGYDGADAAGPDPDAPVAEEAAEDAPAAAASAPGAPVEDREALRRYKRWDRRFSDRLVAEGIISRERLEEALQRSKAERIMLYDLLVREYDVSEETLTRCRAVANDIEFLESPPETPADRSLFDRIPINEARRHLFCPLGVEADAEGREVMRLVVCNPRDFVALENVELYTGMRAKATHMATRRVVLAMIDRFTDEEPATDNEAMGDLVARVSRHFEPAEPDTVEIQRGITEADGPIVRLANRIIEEARERNASDIHIEAEESRVVVRFRIDGSLEDAISVPGHARRALVARLKIMSGCNITEHRLPQDGRIDFARHGGKYRIDLRVNILPTVDGDEDVVIRILADSKPLPLEEIGLLPHVYEPLRRIVEQPYGMILCVGPTGSGKTTTLHSLVSHINRRERKILTAENPVEIRQAGLRQVQIRPEVGLDFKTSLRAFLRQDPDVILVGEMRDLETCSIAVEASLTGHLLLSTLHTNNAPETITRLTEIGIDPVVLSDALLGVLAQRLMKMLCPDCKRPAAPGPRELEEAGLSRDESGILRFRDESWPQAVLYEPDGCDACRRRGFRGRTGVHELLVNGSGIKRAIATGASVHELRDIALGEGMRELYHDGMVKVLRGQSSVSQLRSVCVST